MYAVVETGGKQYRVEPGDTLSVEKVAGEVGSLLELKQVRLVQGEDGLVVGRPWVEQARVTAKIVKHGRTRSITIFKKKRRKNYRRTKGHRQAFTQLEITDIKTA
ncbi:50S ribosomal protein L21 [Nitrospiraceae bacterium AH_259_D15_M11_P09]|nr:50S ribosomal protein L21 [Nitrospiraceae bacterium AH_259_D15_M11_P09]